MKKVFKLNKGEKAKEVYLNGLKQLEGGDYQIKNGNVKFNNFVGMSNKSFGTIKYEEDIVTIIKESTEIVKY